MLRYRFMHQYLLKAIQQRGLAGANRPYRNLQAFPGRHPSQHGFKHVPVRRCQVQEPGIRIEPKWLPRSEEHTSELQSRQYLVCRLLLEKKKKEPTDAAG